MSSLLATWLYSDIASTPRRDATSRMVTAPTPRSSAISIAAARTRSRFRGTRGPFGPASPRFFPTIRLSDG
jgi:hypothetical protein